MEEVLGNITWMQLAAGIIFLMLGVALIIIGLFAGLDDGAGDPQRYIGLGILVAGIGLGLFGSHLIHGLTISDSLGPFGPF